ncbi:unnamed protein product [Rhizoctonia solani]|uniref:Uncharacterized protein n=1 Tax=Rhizoctonia solani TaxID=456999 RepID=A0A8H3EAE2_9AGAM|nr:unnamed protein product [Rhizoctonia solani]
MWISVLAVKHVDERMDSWGSQQSVQGDTCPRFGWWLIQVYRKLGALIALANVLSSRSARRRDDHDTQQTGLICIFISLHYSSFTELCRRRGAVGIVATLKAPAGLFAQCGWFANDDLDWYWARITGWEFFHLRAESRFRDGVPSVTLRSEFTEYMLLFPHLDYEPHWEPTRLLLGAPRCEVWPVGGLRPSWWPDKWGDLWPFTKSTSRRRGPANAADVPQLNKALSATRKKATTLSHIGPRRLPAQSTPLDTQTSPHDTSSATLAASPEQDPPSSSGSRQAMFSLDNTSTASS